MSGWDNNFCRLPFSISSLLPYFPNDPCLPLAAHPVIYMKSKKLGLSISVWRLIRHAKDPTISFFGHQYRPNQEKKYPLYPVSCAKGPVSPRPRWPWMPGWGERGSWGGIGAKGGTRTLEHTDTSEHTGTGEPSTRHSLLQQNRTFTAYPSQWVKTLPL